MSYMKDSENESECSMKSELDDALRERDVDIPMPKMTKTEDLMSPGDGEVEG